MKNPIARVDNRPSLWGHIDATEMQEASKDGAIDKATLRKKLDYYYKKKVNN